jgi:hypothetical protein
MDLLTSNFQLKTPVAFLIFNRPETTAKVFEAIRMAKPPKLLVVADGPRPHRLDDLEKCHAARAIVDQVDWDCQVFQNYSDINLGCKTRVSSGLDWVFNLVDEAIILEDDCLPDITFFRFCEELLDRYRQDSRIMVISGNNFQKDKRATEDSYYFSCYPLSWGWATWKRAWQYYDGEMKLWPKIQDEHYLLSILASHRSLRYWTDIFQKTYTDQINTWDYPWALSCWLQNGLSILPDRNLVSNIGFVPEATHTSNQDHPLANLPTYPMDFPLSHPACVIRNFEADEWTQSNVFQASVFDRIKRHLRKLIKL